MQLTDAVLTGKSRNYSAYRHFLYEIRCRAGDILETVFPEKEASVAKAMLLGEKKGIDRELKSLYQEAGIAHILAISGLHISLLGMGLYRLLTLRLSRKTASLLSSFVLISYLIMTGASLSAVRAVFMFFLYMLAGLAGRTYDMPTALSLGSGAASCGKSGLPVKQRFSAVLHGGSGCGGGDSPVFQDGK